MQYRDKNFGGMQYRDKNFGGMQYRDKNFGGMQYRDKNFGGMQYHDNRCYDDILNQIPILSTNRTKLQMAVDSKFADFGIIIGHIFNLSTDLKSAWNSLSNHIKHVQIGRVLRKLWASQFRTLCCWYLG